MSSDRPAQRQLSAPSARVTIAIEIYRTTLDLQRKLDVAYDKLDDALVGLELSELMRYVSEVARIDLESLIMGRLQERDDAKGD